MKYLIVMILVMAGTYVDAFQGKLTTQDEKSIEISPGESFVGIIRIWPYRGKIRSLKALEGKSISPYFYIHRVKEVRLSPNNNEVLEIFARIILKTDFGITSFMIIDLFGTKIPMTIKNIVVKPLELIPKKIHFIEQDVERILISKIWKMIIMIFIASVSIFSLLYFSLTREKRQLRCEYIKERIKWYRKMTSVQKREEIEEIYRKKKKWSQYLTSDQKGVEELMKIISDNQYCREWDKNALKQTQKLAKEIAEGWVER